MPEASVSLPCDPSSVPEARRFVLRTLEAWGYDDAGWAAAQIVSELAGNCSLHARTDFEIRLLQRDGGVRLEVRDSSPARVQQRRYGTSSTTGRGLRLVDTLAQSWGVDVQPQGKTVWVDLRTSADAGGTFDLEDEAELDALLATFGDDDAGRSTRALDDLRIAA